MSNLIVLIGVVNLYIDCLLIKLNVVQLAIKQLTNWRKLIMLKQLDQIKSLQDQLVAMETKEIRKYLEVKKTIDALRSEVRKEMTSQLIIKPNGFGIPIVYAPSIPIISTMLFNPSLSSEWIRWYKVTIFKHPIITIAKSK